MNETKCEECGGSGWVGEHACPVCAGFGVVPETVRYCAGCGEREGSSYAKHCCANPDNMLED